MNAFPSYLKWAALGLGGVALSVAAVLLAPALGFTPCGPPCCVDPEDAPVPPPRVLPAKPVPRPSAPPPPVSKPVPDLTPWLPEITRPAPPGDLLRGRSGRPSLPHRVFALCELGTANLRSTRLCFRWPRRVRPGRAACLHLRHR